MIQQVHVPKSNLPIPTTVPPMYYHHGHHAPPNLDSTGMSATPLPPNGYWGPFIGGYHQFPYVSIYNNNQASGSSTSPRYAGPSGSTLLPG